MLHYNERTVGAHRTMGTLEEHFQVGKVHQVISGFWVSRDCCVVDGLLFVCG